MSQDKHRLDTDLVARGLAPTRSQAENLIKLGKVQVEGRVETKPGTKISENSAVKLTTQKTYVSRAALKLDSVTSTLGIDFRDKAVLDVGSSTGGFTDYALQHGAKKIIAVDVGSNQLHPSLRNEQTIELHEQTDIRKIKKLSTKIDIVLIDVSFISLREILPHVANLTGAKAQIIAMLKPQFEAPKEKMKHKGVIKNKALRREILKDFERWVTNRFKIVSKADSSVAGEKGNVERFYLLQLLG